MPNIVHGDPRYADDIEVELWLNSIGVKTNPDEAQLLAAIADAEAHLARDDGELAPVEQLRALHERLARVILGSTEKRIVVVARVAAENTLPVETAKRAIAHLAEAERRQWDIGTWATGSGEGLASMAEVRKLQLAQAWLWSALGAGDPDARQAALRLAEEVENDANDVAADLSRSITALRNRLGAA